MSIGEVQTAGNAARPAFLRRLTSTTVEPLAAAPSGTLHRAAVVVLWVGAAAAATAILTGVVGAALPEVPYTWGEFAATTGWHLGYVVRFGLGLVVLRRAPGNAAAAWFAVLMGLELVGELSTTVQGGLLDTGAAPSAVAGAVLVGRTIAVTGGIVALQLIVRLPAGGVEEGVARWARAAWLLVVLPPLAFTTYDVVPIPWYIAEATVANPLQLAVPEGVASVLAALASATDALYVVAIAVVAVRYVRSGAATRRRLRWMLGVPVVAVALYATFGLFPDLPLPVVSLVSAVAVVAVPLFVALTILGPGTVDVDHVLRRSIVYGVMWVAIAGVYVAAGAAVGTAAGARLPAFGAAVLTVVATLAFQPARGWLERLADRWVFGNRADPAHLIAGLGATLEGTYEVDELLPIVQDTVRRGLSVEWARVRLDGAPDGYDRSDDAEAVVSVPITLGDTPLGVLECGPRLGRPLGEQDVVVLETFARQAALAIANVRLTTELTAKAQELTESRTRLVRAQESERRRIERNIHDGVQQELVTLIQHAGEVEQAHAAGADVAGELAVLRSELGGMLTTIRELAAGIHPSLLTDKGLLPAIESLAARHPVPVAVRVDRTLRGRRFSEAVEGAGYFTVAECLANSLKHAGATAVEVRFRRDGDALTLEVEDDGVGIAAEDARRGNGFGNLRARLEALGGGLTVETGPTGGTTVRATMALTDDVASP